jgi:uncharacterized RDD family membrane protein YckC
MQTATATKPSRIHLTRTIDPAPRGARLLACLIDGMIAMGLLVLFFFTKSFVLLFLGAAVLFFGQLYFLAVDGQTVGKKAMAIKIVRAESGDNGGFVTNVLKRVILNAIIGLVPFYALVDILFIFREDRRCIHDMIAGTKVICE